MTTVIGNLLERLEGRFLLRARSGPLGVGLVGIGGWGRVNALNLMRTRRFDIRGVYDIDPGRAESFARRYRTRRLASYEDLLNDPSASSVVLTIPNHHHVEFAARALKAGKNVFVEKPLASAPEDCRKLGELAATSGLVLLVGHQIRREPGIRELKRRLDILELGRPILASGWSTQTREKTDWRTDSQCCPGGSMEQLGSHWIDALIYLFGRPLSSTGWSVNLPRKGAGPEWGHIDLEFEGGIRGTVDSSYSAPDSFGLRAHCERGTWEYDGKSLTALGREGRKRLRVKGPSGGVAQFHEFADCIEGKSRPETGAETAAEVMKAITKMVPCGKRFR